jgi:glycosyltransferase involved in cell wall biosynthesis
MIGRARGLLRKSLSLVGLSDQPSAGLPPPRPLDTHPPTPLKSLKCLPDVYSYLDPPATPRRSHPEDASPPDFNRLTITWVTPNFDLVSGGMRIIFELMHYLETKGHKNTLHVFGQSHYQSGDHAKQTILQKYCHIDADVFLGIENVAYSDILISAGWQTAWAAHHYLEARKKFYLVQDYEPYFYAMGSEHVLAEQPLSFGMYGLTLGPWAQKVVEKFGMRATPFDFAIDHTSFFPKDGIQRKKKTVVFYGRFVTPRRAFEFGVVALYLLLKERPDTEVIFHGWYNPSGNVPFEYANVGILPDEQRAQLYREATVGVALSLTNPSMVPLEMMACKLPVVELKGDNTTTFYGQGYDQFISLAEPSPRKIADAIIDLLDNEEKRIAFGERGHDYVAQRTWPKAGAVVEGALIRELKRELGIEAAAE